MSSWKESSDGRRESIFLPPTDSDSPLSLDPSLLEKVLEKTLDVGESVEALDGATRASLLDFARSNAAAEISETILADLVQVVLKQEIALLAGQPGWSSLSDQVAHSIWEDPAARGRISNIWRLLRGRTT